MKLLIFFGPPAVGKTTVGKIIEAQTDFKLFHNHMVMDGVIHIFEHNSPAEERLSRLIRGSIIEEAAKSGVDLIFTYVWNFSRDKGKQNIDAYKNIYEQHGGEVQFVELVASLDERVTRAGSPDRFKYKTYTASADDVANKDQAIFDSPEQFYYPGSYTQIDTTGKTADQVAKEVVALL